jgi:hypothetical protein
METGDLLESGAHVGANGRIPVNLRLASLTSRFHTPLAALSNGARSSASSTARSIGSWQFFVASAPMLILLSLPHIIIPASPTSLTAASATVSVLFASLPTMLGLRAVPT